MLGIASLKALIRKPSARRVEEQRLSKLVAEIRDTERQHELAYASSRLERLKARGVPFVREQAPPQPLQQSKPSMHPVMVYETDPQTGYPFKPGIVFEQDPIFGWELNNIWGWDLGSDVPVSAFPREMFPERPTTLRTQIAMDAIRFQSRMWYETLPCYSGAIGHLRNFIIGSGLIFNVVSEDDEELAKDVKEWIDEFAKFKFNRLDKRLWDSVLNFFRDGEDAIRLFPGPEYPEIRSVDTSTIRGPHNEINGPWSFGILTSWPKDFEDVKAIHLWYADNTHEDISPTQLKLLKLDTTGSNVKRGVPLAYKIRKQLPQMAKLLDCMAIGEAARQAIPYLVSVKLADKGTSHHIIPGQMPEAEHYEDVLASRNGHKRDDIEPGEVRYHSAGQEYNAPPTSDGGTSGTLTYRALCENIACALNVPLWFVTGSADTENFASSLVSESPVTKLIQHYQKMVTEHYQEVLESAVLMAAAQGIFPANVLDTCQIHCELPSPVARNRKENIEIDLQLLDKKCLSPQHVCARNELDFEEETKLLAEAEEGGWTNELGVLRGERAEKAGNEAGPEADEKTGNEPQK